MNPMTVPFIVKSSHPTLTAVLLAIVGAAIGLVLYLMLRHRRSNR